MVSSVKSVLNINQVPENYILVSDHIKIYAVNAI